MINGVTNGGAIGVLERLMQFAGERHRIITNNIANISTPNFRPKDVSVPAFQAQLREAIDARRADPSAGRAGLPMKDSAEVQVTADGLELRPEPIGENILFHDGNDRDSERLVQDLVENFSVFRMAAQFMRKEFAMINAAISERT
ncbi:MAG: hypothetical protein KC983_08925 [Phycisphaerales bacterium]|nr:hypothetical protein [Phycisphaerales bacterium]